MSLQQWVGQALGKSLTSCVELITPEYDVKKILKAFKKDFACNGTLVEDPELGEVIQLQGDQRQKIAAFLVEVGIPKDTVRVHGF